MTEMIGWRREVLAKFPALNHDWPPGVMLKWFDDFAKLAAQLLEEDNKERERERDRP